LGDYSRARQNWSTILDQNPADAEARYGLSIAFFSEAQKLDREHRASITQWESALYEFRILLQIDSTQTIRAMASTSLFQVARARYGEELFAQSDVLLDDAIRLDSTNWFAWNLKGLALEGLGRFDDAQASYEQILIRNPDFISAYVNLGNLHWSQGRIEDAWDDWSLGLQRDSTNVYLKHWVERAANKLLEKDSQK
jgi:tetratricopeptide (TPR) repeat protein